MAALRALQPPGPGAVDRVAGNQLLRTGRKAVRQVVVGKRAGRATGSREAGRVRVKEVAHRVVGQVINRAMDKAGERAAGWVVNNLQMDLEIHNSKRCAVEIDLTTFPKVNYLSWVSFLDSYLEIFPRTAHNV